MCNCIEKIDSELKKQNLDMNKTFGFTGGKKPLIEATNEIYRQPGEKKKIHILKSTFCPFCGEKY